MRIKQDGAPKELVEYVSWGPVNTNPLKDPSSIHGGLFFFFFLCTLAGRIARPSGWSHQARNHLILWQVSPQIRGLPPQDLVLSLTQGLLENSRVAHFFKDPCGIKPAPGLEKRGLWGMEASALSWRPTAQVLCL